MFNLLLNVVVCLFLHVEGQEGSSFIFRVDPVNPYAQSSWDPLKLSLISTALSNSTEDHPNPEKAS